MKDPKKTGLTKIIFTPHKLFLLYNTKLRHGLQLLESINVKLVCTMVDFEGYKKLAC